MAITVVHSYGNAQNSLVVTPGFTPAVGNALIIVAMSPNMTAGFTSLVDNQGGGTANVFAGARRVYDRSGVNMFIDIWWCSSIVTAAGAYTLTFGGSGGIYCFGVLECTGITGFDQGTGATDTAGNASSLTITNPLANPTASALVVCGVNFIPADLSGSNLFGATDVPTTGYTSLASANNASAGSSQQISYKIVNSIETSSATYPTFGGAGKTCVGIVGTFKGTAVVALPTKQILLDDPAHVGASDQLLIGTVEDDKTGEHLRAGGVKLKQWAADVNLMTGLLFPKTQFRGDVNYTAVMADAKFIYCNATLTANRVYTLPSSGLSDGDVFQVIRKAVTPGAFTLTVTDPLSGRSVVIASGTNGFAHWRAVSASEWVCYAQGTLT